MRWQLLLRTARSYAQSSSWRSSTLPTRGTSARRARPGAPGRTSTSRIATTGSALPLSGIGGIGMACTASRTSASVAGPSRTSPAAAACSRRAARLTGSPSTRASPTAGSPATTSPVLTPVRTWSITPQLRDRSWLTSTSPARSSAAARTARRASSSWTTGTPKTAITASPMNFWTVPPCRSSTARMASNQRAITRLSDSGSRRSPRLVDPATSLKTTVTVLRVSRPVSRVPSAVPQFRQNRARLGFSTPQLRQVTTTPVSAIAAEHAEQLAGLRGRHEVALPLVERDRLAGQRRRLGCPTVEPQDLGEVDQRGRPHVEHVGLLGHRDRGTREPLRLRGAPPRRQHPGHRAAPLDLRVQVVPHGQLAAVPSEAQRLLAHRLPGQQLDGAEELAAERGEPVRAQLLGDRAAGLAQLPGQVEPALHGVQPRQGVQGGHLQPVVASG